MTESMKSRAYLIAFAIITFVTVMECAHREGKVAAEAETIMAGKFEQGAGR